MAGPNLSTSRTVSNTPNDHVADHNAAHAIVDLFDLAAPSAGQVPTWNATTGLYVPGGSSIINAKSAPYGAVGDGVANDTAALTAVRDGSAVGATVYLPKGTYLCSGLTLSVTGQRWLLAEGAVIKAIASITGNLITISAAGIVFEGGGIDGNKTNQSADRDGLVVNAANVTVRGVEAQNCRGNGIALASGAVGCHIIGNYSHDNGITGNSSAGIHVNDGSQNRIIGNRCENNGTVAMGGANDGDGIRLQGTAGTGQNLVSGNICRNNARRGVKIQQGFATVTNNIFAGNGVAAIGLTNSASPQNTPTTITGNISIGDYRGFQIDNSTCIIISDNVTLAAVDYGLLANTAPFQVVLSGNVFSGGQRHGAVVQGGQDWVINGNLFIDNGQAAVNRYGLSLERDTGASRDCSRINVTGNTSHNSGTNTTQTHGFVLSGTAPDRIIMIGNNATNGVTTAYSLVAGRTNSYEWANAGSVGDNSDIPWGSHFMAAGTTIGGTATGFKISGQASHKLGFFGTAPVAQQAVTGSRGGNAALASVLTALANLGLITDGSTA